MTEMEKVNMVATFHTALLDCFRDEDDRQLKVFMPVELGGQVSGNDIILSMLQAFQATVSNLTEFDGDPLDFLALLHRILLVDAIENGSTKSADESEVDEDFANLEDDEDDDEFDDDEISDDAFEDEFENFKDEDDSDFE